MGKWVFFPKMVLERGNCHYTAGVLQLDYRMCAEVDFPYRQVRAGFSRLSWCRPCAVLPVSILPEHIPPHLPLSLHAFAALTHTVPL